jgi:hypothetical protein
MSNQQNDQEASGRDIQFYLSGSAVPWCRFAWGWRLYFGGIDTGGVGRMKKLIVGVVVAGGASLGLPPSSAHADQTVSANDMCARHHAGYVALPPQGPRGDGFSYAKCQPATDLWGFMLNDYLAPSYKAYPIDPYNCSVPDQFGANSSGSALTAPSAVPLQPVSDCPCRAAPGHR